MVFSIEDVNAFDRMFMNDYSKPLDYASTGLEALSVLMPLCLLGTSTGFVIPFFTYFKF